MGRTYKATGINLKGMPLGESDRLLTILTKEFGLIRAVAPGARKPNSQMGGRSGVFVVNELLIHKGRSLDKIAQAQTLESYPGLSRDFGKLAASQYLAEVVLCQALSEQPQEDLFCLLNEHLRRLERLPNSGGGQTSASVLAHIAQGVFHLLALAGIAPQVQACCIAQQPTIPNFEHPNWRVGFSIAAGGIVNLSEIAESSAPEKLLVPRAARVSKQPTNSAAIATTNQPYRIASPSPKPLKLDAQLDAVELSLLQQLAEPQLSEPTASLSDRNAHASLRAWVSVERILRQYAQYHFDRSIRSAALMDTYFASEADFPHQL